MRFECWMALNSMLLLTSVGASPLPREGASGLPLERCSCVMPSLKGNSPAPLAGLSQVDMSLPSRAHDDDSIAPAGEGPSVERGVAHSVGS